MRGKIKNSVRTLLVVVLTMAMVMQTFCGLNFITQAAEETEYEELTFRDWGIVDGSYPADWTNKLKDSRLTSLDGTAFTGIINFNGNSDGGHAMRIGAPYREWTALQIYYRASDNALIFLDATGGGGSYGIALGEGGNSRDIKLRLTFDYDAANTTWNIGIWIDDEFKTTHAFANMSLGTCLMINGTVTLKDAITAYKLPEGYQIYTHKNFGVPYGTYTVANGTAAVSGSVSGIANFDKAILHFPKITFDGDVDLNFAGPGPWEGFKIRSASSTGKLTLRSGYGQFVTSPVSMTDDIAGVDVVGGSYDLKISIQYVDDATIKMGIWFNDALYDNKYVYVDVSEKSNDKLGLYMGITSTTGGGTITLERKHVELQSLGWKDFDVNYKRFTANDYVRTTSVTNLVNTSFRGRVRFDRKSTTGNYWLGYGDPNGSWRGIRIFPDGNGVLNIKAVNPDNSYGIRESILPGDAGITSFIDTEFELGIDIEAEGDDAEIYIYVDGRKCNAEAYVWTDAVKNNCIGNGILFILGVEEDAIVAGDSGKRYYDLAKMDGGYLLSGTGSIVVNGEVRQNGDVLDIPGDYDITITDEESEYVRRVILYKAGDAHPDGEMNVADLIATKKAVEGIALQTEAGLKGADINQDSGINAEDVGLARQVLIGIVEVSAKAPSLSFVSGETSVMPIAGFYGAYGSLLTEDVYQMVQNCGINLVTYSEDTYHVTGQTENVIAQLELAEKYGISLFIRDKALQNMSYTATELAEIIAEYSSYESFKGITIADEPVMTDVYGSSDGKDLSRYNQLASSVNSYVNLAGYVNLLPYASHLGDETAYQSYLEEYCNTFHPRMISFDDYPFNEESVESCSTYFRNLAIVREKALAHNIPFWAFVQAGQWNAPSSVTELTEAQMQWNVNMNLAFGAKGIQYFPMIQPNPETYPQFAGNALIDVSGKKTVWYDYAKGINAQITAVDDVLMNSESRGLMTVGYYADLNTKDCGIPVIESYREVTEISTSESALGGRTYGVAAGCFDFNGKTAVYVVNYDVTNYNEITLTLDNTYKTQVISMEGVENKNDNFVTVKLGAGGAALILIQ